MRMENWSLILVGIEHMEPFNDVYGFVAGDEVLRFTAILLNEAVNDLGTDNDFIGHASSSTFIITTHSRDVPALLERLRQEFNEGIKTHYNFMDTERGGIEMPDGRIAPLMRLSLGVVSDKTQRFSDIREITEMAAEMRRLDQTA